jgi:N-acetylglucosaminyldiphosphoundecaprenol N-acetyl-beta-D-mannosaminyltransferase
MDTPFRVGTGQGEVIVNIPDRSSLFDSIRDRFEAGQGFALATVNLDHLVKLRASEAFRDAYAAQDLVVADGNPIVWLSRLAGRPVSLLPGSDLVLPLARLAAEQGKAVALVGSTEDVLARAAERLEAEIPAIRIGAILAPSQGFDPEGPEADRLIADLARSGTGLSFLALGAPRQEILAARGRRALPAMGFASIGAGLDFLAGGQLRAPRWIRGIAMEWLWRTALSPRRLAMRYLKCGLILPGLVLETVLRRPRV